MQQNHSLLKLYTKQGPAGQRCVHGHIKHMKHMYEAHVWSTWSTPSTPCTLSVLSILDCPNDFQRENSSFSAFKKKQVTQGRTDGWTDRRTDRRTDGQTDTTSYRDARTHL